MYSASQLYGPTVCCFAVNERASLVETGTVSTHCHRVCLFPLMPNRFFEGAAKCWQSSLSPKPESGLVQVAELDSSGFHHLLCIGGQMWSLLTDKWTFQIWRRNCSHTSPVSVRLDLLTGSNLSLEITSTSPGLYSPSNSHFCCFSSCPH